MRNILFIVIALLFCHQGYSQITITSSDMPVAGDTLRYSMASLVGATISPGDSGANVAWNYTFTPISQAVDTYQLAYAVNPLYALAGLTAYGYKVNIPIPVPGVTITQEYTFFENSSAKFEAKAFAANISGVPSAFNYSTPDDWYFFPLSYLNQDSSDFVLSISVPSLGSIKQTGSRITRVDGWGTITTPYYTTPVNCIRIRSVVSGVDSVTFGTLPPIAIPQNTVEYKWLVNGQHYPALWVTSSDSAGTEKISSIRYRDNPLPDTTTADTNSSVPVISKNIVSLAALPNPAIAGVVTLELPAGWKTFEADLYDMSSRLVGTYKNERELNIQSLPSGAYVCRVISGGNTGYVVITK